MLLVFLSIAFLLQPAARGAPERKHLLAGCPSLFLGGIASYIVGGNGLSLWMKNELQPPMSVIVSLMAGIL